MPGKFRHVIEYVDEESTNVDITPKPKHFKFTEECWASKDIIDISEQMITPTKKQVTIEFKDSDTRDWWWETIEAMADSDQPSNIVAYHDRVFF